MDTEIRHKQAAAMFNIPVSDGSSSGSPNHTLENHSTELSMPIFSGSEGSTVTHQPLRAQDDSSYPGARRLIPVLTDNWQTTNLSQFTPACGVDFLFGASKLFIQQTMELNALLENRNSENRYTVKVPQGETLYYASETSNDCQRMCFGSSRSFSMRLYDHTHQEAMEFRRRLACGTCSFWCYLQAIEIWVPPGELIGIVKQQVSLSKPLFFAYGRNNDILYRLEGPNMCGCVNYTKVAHFKVYSADGMTQVGSINHQWDQGQVAYNMCLQFPAGNIRTKDKAILLGAAFLLEYLYFEKGKQGCSCKCMC